MYDVMDIVNDNTDEWKAAFEQAVARGLEEVGLVAEGYAKAICPVDTGRFRNSITHAQLDGTHEAVGTNVEYARYVEQGTSRHAEKPESPRMRTGALTNEKTSKSPNWGAPRSLQSFYTICFPLAQQEEHVILGDHSRMRGEHRRYRGTRTCPCSTCLRASALPPVLSARLCT